LRCAAGNAVLSHGGHKFLWHAQQKGVFSRSEGERPEPITRRHGTTGTLRAPASTAGVRPLSISMGLYLPKGTTRMIFASIDRGARSIAPWSLAALGIPLEHTSSCKLQWPPSVDCSGRLSLNEFINWWGLQGQVYWTSASLSVRRILIRWALFHRAIAVWAACRRPARGIVPCIHAYMLRASHPSHRARRVRHGRVCPADGRLRAACDDGARVPSDGNAPTSHHLQ
jgi:hypothetical protein